MAGNMYTHPWRNVGYGALVFALGLLAGTLIWVLLVRAYPERMLSAVGASSTGQKPAGDGQQAAPEQQSVLNAQEQHRYEFQKSFGAIIDDQRVAQGFERNHYTYTNLINIDQNTLGLLHAIGSGGAIDDPELEQFLQQVKSQREAEVERLLTLQKSSGHSHH